MPSRPLMDVKRHAVYAMALHAQVWYAFLMKRTPIVSTKPVPVSSMLSAAENLLIFGTDMSNAFAKAPPPKQGFFIRPDEEIRPWAYWYAHRVSLD